MALNDVLRSGDSEIQRKLEGEIGAAISSGRYEAIILDEPWYWFMDEIEESYEYRGSAIPSMQGFYYCADFLSGSVWAVDRSGSTFSVREVLDRDWVLSSFGEGDDGTLYLCSRSDGAVYAPVTNSDRIAVSEDSGITWDFIRTPIHGPLSIAFHPVEGVLVGFGPARPRRRVRFGIRGHVPGVE